jgi:protein disulfide-isomerase
MKKLTLSFVLVSLALAVRAADLEWLTDLPKAQAKAKQDKKIVMLDFTGSDWCGWCIKLNKEVFSTPEFATYAKANLVLVEVDFPKRKKISAEQQKANEALQEKYGVPGYPTLILLNGEGKKIGQLGYMPGGPKPFLAELDKLRKK